MKSGFKIIVVLYFIICSGLSPSQINEDTNAHIKATFIYNFTRYIEWPLELKKGNFVIGVIGSTPLFSELGDMRDKTTRGNQYFAINKYSSVNSMGNCHIVFVAKDFSGKIQEIAKKFEGKPTLIITESPGMIEKGADINFVITGNKHGFEINKGNIAGHGLSLASSLASFATKVI